VRSPDGAIAIRSSFPDVLSASNVPTVIRLLPSGALDGSFGAGGTLTLSGSCDGGPICFAGYIAVTGPAAGRDVSRHRRHQQDVRALLGDAEVGDICRRMAPTRTDDPRR
jgi:hypothetical protein